MSLELGERHAAARERLVIAAGEPQHHAARDPPLGLAELAVGGLRQAGDRPAHATARPVALIAQRPPVASPPQLEQRRGEQRQSPGLTRHVGHQRVNQSMLDLQPGASGRLLDRPRQLVAIHRPDQHVTAAQQLREPGIGGEAAVEIRPQRHHDERSPLGVARRRHQLLEERRTLLLALTHGEQLLQLVDRDHDPLTRRKLPEHLTETIAVERAPELDIRVLARPQQHLAPPGAARQHARAQRRQHTRAQQRRLADARRAEDPDQRRLHQPREQI